MITYLASPYSHDNPAIKEARFKRVCEEAAKLTDRGEIIFCPISHSHPIDQCFDSPRDWVFWKRLDFAILEKCAKLKVLMLPGWDESVGVHDEIQHAHKLGIPVEYIDAYPV